MERRKNMTLEEYQKAKKNIDNLQRELNKKEGLLESVMQQLKENNCNSLEEAKKVLNRVNKKRKIVEDKFNEKLKEFEEKWKDKLNDIT